MKKSGLAKNKSVKWLPTNTIKKVRRLFQEGIPVIEQFNNLTNQNAQCPESDKF